MDVEMNACNTIIWLNHSHPGLSQADEQTVAMIIQMKTLVEVGRMGRVATSPESNAIWLNHWITELMCIYIAI